MVSGARTVLLATNECFATPVFRAAEREKPPGSQGLGAEESRSRFALGVSEVLPNLQFAHNQVQRGIPLLCEDEQGESLLARLNASHSGVIRCQGTDSGGVAAAAVLVARPDSSSFFVFLFPTSSERFPERAVIDPVSRAEPANFSFAQGAVVLPFVFDCWSQLSKLDCVQDLSCSKLELTTAADESTDFSEQFTRCRNHGGLKSCSCSPYSSLCWSSKRCVTNFVFRSAVDRVPVALIELRGNPTMVRSNVKCEAI